MRSEGLPAAVAVASAIDSGARTRDRASSHQRRNWSSGSAARSLRASGCPRSSIPRAYCFDSFTLVHAFGVANVVEKHRCAGGGYEVVHASAGLELGGYVLVAPEPDRQHPHEDDEVYVVL